MTRLAIKSLWARKVRAFATSLAVILGVAFIAGSYVLTDTIFAAFDEIFSESLKGTAVVVTAQNPVKQEGGEVPTVPASYLPKVQGVAGSEGSGGGDLHAGRLLRRRKQGDRDEIRAEVHLLDAAEGARVADLRRRAQTARARAKPRSTRRRPNRRGSKIGDTLKIVGAGRAVPFKLVGLTQLGQASFGGASIAQVTLPVAQRLTHKRGRARPDLGRRRPTASPRQR